LSDSVIRPDLDIRTSDSPVTAWLRQLEEGNSESAGDIYQHFCVRLQNLIRGRIPANVRATYDDDDVAVSAFHSLFLGVRERRYQLADRTDFWRLLLTIAERKISERVRYETRGKRDVRRVAQNSVFLRLPKEQQDDGRGGVESLAGREPTPEFAAEVGETCEALLALLPNDAYRRIALLRLENHTAEEIAAELDCTRRTVQRKLLVIRRAWRDEGGTVPSTEKMSQLEDKRTLEITEGTGPA
jgi:DNA-directed RNA polymerase specialized sigma24 family protein